MLFTGPIREILSTDDGATTIGGTAIALPAVPSTIMKTPVSPGDLKQVYVDEICRNVEAKGYEFAIQFFLDKFRSPESTANFLTSTDLEGRMAIERLALGSPGVFTTFRVLIPKESETKIDWFDVVSYQNPTTGTTSVHTLADNLLRSLGTAKEGEHLTMLTTHILFHEDTDVNRFNPGWNARNRARNLMLISQLDANGISPRTILIDWLGKTQMELPLSDRWLKDLLEDPQPLAIK